MDVAVIGAGPAGLTAAYRLAQQGWTPHVFEQRPRVGGLAQSLSLWGHTVDLGPHRFFSKDPRVNRLWLEIVVRDYHMVERLTRIYYRSRFFQYPLQPRNALTHMGLFEAIACMGSYVKQKLGPQHAHPDSFEGWVVQRFGRRLFEMFFKSYSEKLWGIPCDQLDAEFAAQRIKKFSLGQAILSSLGMGGHRHRTLVDCFAYPTGGTGMVYDRMADAITQRGGQVHTKQAIDGLTRDGQRITGIRMPGGHEQPFDHVISTMPLTHMVASLGHLPAPVEEALSHLTFRNTILVYLRVQATALFPDQWLYIHAPTLRMGRLTNFSNWGLAHEGEPTDTVLALEYWCQDEDAIWHEEDAPLIARAIAETRATGLLGDAAVPEGRVIRLPRSYPIYQRGYKQHLQTVIDYLRTFENLTVIGRYGAFKYNNQDHSMLMGLLAAENLTAGTSHDLWSINSDDAYHESSRITASGLVEEPAG